jgi:hypothetical protein
MRLWTRREIGEKWDSSPIWIRGTAQQFNRQNSMNEHPSYKTIGDLGRRLRLVARNKRLTSKSRRSTLETELSAQHARDFYWPARELLIALGWLRLFRTIVSPSYRHER